MAYTDNFDSYADNSNLGDAADWDVTLNNVLVQKPAADGRINPNGNNDCSVHYSAQSFADDQYSQVVMESNVGGNIAVQARCGSSDGNYYEFAGSTTNRWLGKKVGGSGTTLATTATDGWNINDVCRIECEGTTITPLINGSADPGIAAQTDSAHSSGWPGLGGYGYGDEVNGNMDDWEGGDLAPPPSAMEIAIATRHFATLRGE